jgi:hypothetical protein
MTPVSHRLFAITKKPRAKSSAGLSKKSSDCLAVFYVEQVALNRHASKNLKKSTPDRPETETLEYDAVLEIVKKKLRVSNISDPGGI